MNDEAINLFQFFFYSLWSSCSLTTSRVQHKWDGWWIHGAQPQSEKERINLMNEMNPSSMRTIKKIQSFIRFSLLYFRWIISHSHSFVALEREARREKKAIKKVFHRFLTSAVRHYNCPTIAARSAHKKFSSKTSSLMWIMFIRRWWNARLETGAEVDITHFHTYTLRSGWSLRAGQTHVVFLFSFWWKEVLSGHSIFRLFSLVPRSLIFFLSHKTTARYVSAIHIFSPTPSKIAEPSNV